MTKESIGAHLAGNRCEQDHSPAAIPTGIVGFVSANLAGFSSAHPKSTICKWFIRFRFRHQTSKARDLRDGSQGKLSPALTLTKS
jgi:hypothetical protein